MSTVPSPLRFSSRVILKYLSELEWFITLPSQDTSNLSTLLNLCWDPKRMDSVLPRCKDNNLMSIRHCLQDSSSLLKTSEITFRSLWDENRALSSAYRSRLQLTLVEMCLTEHKKKKQALNAILLNATWGPIPSILLGNSLDISRICFLLFLFWCDFFFFLFLFLILPGCSFRCKHLFFHEAKGQNVLNSLTVGL